MVPHLMKLLKFELLWYKLQFSLKTDYSLTIIISWFLKFLTTFMALQKVWSVALNFALNHFFPPYFFECVNDELLTFFLLKTSVLWKMYTFFQWFGFLSITRPLTNWSFLFIAAKNIYWKRNAWKSICSPKVGYTKHTVPEVIYASYPCCMKSVPSSIFFYEFQVYYFLGVAFGFKVFIQLLCSGKYYKCNHCYLHNKQAL